MCTFILIKALLGTKLLMEQLTTVIIFEKIFFTLFSLFVQITVDLNVLCV